jgi:predicted NBD/HSP70 family sugar kinase
MAGRCRSELAFVSTAEQECIEHLFAEASAGRSEALRIIDDMASLLAKAVASALLITISTRS